MTLGCHRTRSRALTGQLCDALVQLVNDPYPHIPNPVGCKKRASVACIIRIRPTEDLTSNNFTPRIFSSSISDQLKSHFDREWVIQGEPEILFIRRAARQGDRWTSQVALPGGKRDPEDSDDQATSIRETLEEVGLDLNSRSILPVGKLPERIITTEWGTVPLMVLCPFAYLVLDSEMPSLKLQPEEIASTHWVPIRALMDPSLWTYEAADASDRFAKRGGLFLKYAFRLTVGHMLFGAIKLLPSESLYASTKPEPQPVSSQSIFRQLGISIPTLFPGMNIINNRPKKSLLLWGLTHGIIIDLLRLIPDSKVLSSWKWPTFSAPDTRFLVWLISLQFRQTKKKGVDNSPRGPFMVIEEGFASHDGPGNDTGPIDLDTNRRTEGLLSRSPSSKPGQHSAVHYMLHGYFDLIQEGLVLSLALRIGLGVLIFGYTLNWTRSRR